MTYSPHFKEKTAALSGEAPRVLLEITHPQLGAPIRVVNDTQDLVSNGNTFIAMAFRVSLPDDFAQQLPRARIAIDNIGRELTQWLEASNGGAGAAVRMMQVMPDTPDVLECDYTLDLLNVRQNMIEVSGDLGYEDTLNRPGMVATYRPENTPGIF
jgi:hypothetical protein